MKDNMSRVFTRAQQTFMAFTPGQRLISVIGSVALLLGGFMVFHWASTPSYSPLYTNLASADASSVIDALNTKGVPYKIADGGSTIEVPQQDVYSARITLSGMGLPANSSSTTSGYSILNKQGLSTSDFQQQTDYKIAMETELANTIQAINGVNRAVVHLAIPQQQAFATNQTPPTASVLVEMSPGASLDSEQVQAIVNLVASSITGLKPENVTVADSTGAVLSAAGQTSSAADGTQAQDVQNFQSRVSGQVQQMLDRVVGPGNSNVQITANLDFDKTTTQQTRYFYNRKIPALAAASSVEKYKGAGAPGAGVGGVVGPNGQMNSTATGAGSTGNYQKIDKSSDNAVDKTVETREAAPGNVKSLHVGVVLDSRSAGTISPAAMKTLIASTLGLNPKRGDTVDVTTMPFNRTPEKQAAADLAAANKAAATSQRNSMMKTGGIILVLLLVLILAWLRGRKKAKARQQATTYVVEQLRRDAADRAATQALEMPNPALVALEGHHDLDGTQEIAALVERQPEDVAALLRGWLVDR